MKTFCFNIVKTLFVAILVSSLCPVIEAAPLCPAKKSPTAKEEKLKSPKQVAINCPVGLGADEICKIKGLAVDLTYENVKVTNLAKVPCVAKMNYFLEEKAIRVTGGCRGTFLVSSSKLEPRCTFAGMEAQENTCCEGLVYLEGTKVCAFPYTALTLESLLYNGLPLVEKNCEIGIPDEFKKRLNADEEFLGVAENMFTAIDTKDMNFQQRMSENSLKAEMNPLMKGTFGLPAILFNAFTNYRYATYLAQKAFRTQTDKDMNDSSAAANDGMLKIAVVTCPAAESDAIDGIHECSIGGNVVLKKAISVSVSERFSTTPCLAEKVFASKDYYDTKTVRSDDVGDFGFVIGAPEKIWTRGKCRAVFEVRYVPNTGDTNTNEFILPSDSPYFGLKEQDIYQLVMKNIIIAQIAWYESLGKATEELDKNLEKAMQLGSDMAWLCAHKRQCYERQWSVKPLKGRAEKFFDPVYSLQAPPKFVQKVKSGKLKGQLKKNISLKAVDWNAFLAWADQYEHYNYLYTNLNQTGLEGGGEKTSSLVREFAVEKDFPCLENNRTARSPIGKIEVPLRLRAAALNLIAYYKAMIDLNYNRVTVCPLILPTPVPPTPTPIFTPGVVPTFVPGTPVPFIPGGANIPGIPNSALSAGSANTAKSAAGAGNKYGSDRLGPGSGAGRAAFFARTANRLADAKNAAVRLAGKNPSWSKASSLLEKAIASNVPGSFAAGGISSFTGNSPSSSLPASTSSLGEGNNTLGMGGSSGSMKSIGLGSNSSGVAAGAAVSNNAAEDDEGDADSVDEDEEGNAAAEKAEEGSAEESLESICAYDADRNAIAAPSDNIFLGVMCAYRRHYPDAVKDMGIPKLSSEVKE